MGRQEAVVLYVVAMAAVIVGVDFVFFRNRFWERLTVNIGIVLVFAAFYLNSSGVHEQGAIAPFSCDCAHVLRTRYRRVICVCNIKGSAVEKAE